MISAFLYVKDNKITTSKIYPYTAEQQECRTRSGVFGIKGYTELSGCVELANGLIKRPISVGVDATNWALYKQGVFGDCGVNLNHGVLVVGVSDRFWKVKNSWGREWGESGYIRLQRGNTCGVCYIPSYPVAG